MAPAAPFNPPAADLPGKPHVPTWVPPPVTKETHNFAELSSIDLSLLDSEDPAVVDGLVQKVKQAIRDDGFLFLENYGISLEQLHRQFSIAQYLYHNISEEDKERLLFSPDKGVWSGYKHPYGFKASSVLTPGMSMDQRLTLFLQRSRGPPDGIEQFNWYKPDWEDVNNRVPKCIHPFMDEIEAFCNYLTKSVNRRLLTLFSRVLELPDDYLWDNVQSHGSPTGEGYFRHALFRPVQKSTEEASKGLRMHGHTDFGLTTLLFSVPISCLQIWGRDEKWYYVPYKPGALVINIGDTLEIVSGGHFKATRHRVFKPPVDQLHEERLSLVLFNSSVGDLRMGPATASPLIQREGCVEDQGVYSEFKRRTNEGQLVPTNKQWREIQISTATDPTDTVRNRVGADQVIIDGKLMHQREYMGVKVVLPLPSDGSPNQGDKRKMKSIPLSKHPRTWSWKNSSLVSGPRPGWNLAILTTCGEHDADSVRGISWPMAILQLQLVHPQSRTTSSIYGLTYAAVSRLRLSILRIPLITKRVKAMPIKPDEAYEWLEPQQAPECLDWVAQQNDMTKNKLDALPGTADIEKKLRELATTDLQVPKFSISGDHIFRILKTSENEHGLLQIAKKPAPEDLSPVKWETILDVDGLNTAEGKKYELPPGSLADKLWATPGATRLLLSLSDGGSDVSGLREFDIEQRAFVQDGFRTGTGRMSFAWLDLDHILISHALTGGGVTRSNWPTTTYVWQRGTELNDARAVYSIPTTDVLSMLSSLGLPGSGRALILRVIDFQTFCRVIVSPDGSVHEVEMPRNQVMNVSQRHESHIVASLKSTAKFCGRDLPEGSLIAYDTSPGLHDDQRQSIVWVPEPGECAPYILTGGLAMTRSTIHLVVLKDGVQRRLVFRFTDGAWSIKRSVPIEAGATPTIDDADSGSDDIIITDSGLLLPSTVQLERDNGTRTVFYRQPPAFDAGAFQVELKSTDTLDGTASIDYIILSPKRLKESKQNHGPVLMTGYGGFGITLPMQYLGQAFGGISLVPWLEAGGSLVVPAIRGGGDRGPAWHEAARKENRQKSYDDFAAVADRLVADGVATPGRIGVFGVSNGGLLSAVMGTQRPDLFGAVVSDVPLADMLRFTLMGMGAAWIDEYGDPADPAMAEVLRSYSPFHNIRDGGKYPPFLVTVSTKDDRVGAGHARKLAAKLQDAGAEVYFSEEAEGGHGVSDPFRRAAFMARRVSFLISNLG